MVDKPAQTFIDNKFPNQADKNAVTIINDATINITVGDKLTGPLVLRDFPNVTEINLTDHKLTSVEIINCQKLEEIDFFGNQLNKLDFDKAKTNDAGEAVAADNLKHIQCGNNQLTRLSFEHCPNLVTLKCGENPHLTWFIGIEDLENISELSTGKVKIRSAYAEKINHYKNLVKTFKKMVGADPKKPLPDSLKTDGKFDSNKLKEQVKDKVGATVQAEYPQLKADKAKAEQEAKTAKEERDQLKQQLVGIIKELRLDENASNQQVTDKIKKLMNRPTNVCSHSDYDAIKSERDSLQKQVNNLQSKNNRLKNENKENKNLALTRKILVDATKNWGIKFSKEQENKIQNSSTVNEIEAARNEVIKSEFGKLKTENSNSVKISIGLGVLAIGSLLILTWMLMKQSNLPEMEPEKKKK